MVRQNNVFKRIVYLFTEGKSTEPKYVRDFEKTIEDKVRIDPKKTNVTDPINLIKEATQFAKNFVVNKQQIPTIVCVVFDKDNCPDDVIKQAFDMVDKYNESNKNKFPVYIIYSKPCIEIWGLIHFTNKINSVNSLEIQKQLHKFMPSYDHSKGAIFDIKLMTEEKYKNAVELAKSWENSCCGDFASSHFYTDMYKLTEFIKKGLPINKENKH